MQQAQGPEIARHTREMVGNLALQLAAAQAVIEQLEKALAEAQAAQPKAEDPAS